MTPSSQSHFHYIKYNTSKKLIVLLYLLFLLPISSGLLFAKNDTNLNFYEKGLELKQKGKYKEALNVWLSARSNLSKSEIDPRIGFSFIQLVTEHRFIKYYKTASLMYYWSLSGNTFQEYSYEIENEIQRIKPLLPDKVFREWNTLLKNDNPKLLNEIHKFWGKLDPTIDTIHNERLLEHWERINYARDNFQKNKNLVYPSDERGSIYIKYGHPERIKKGSFRFNTLRIQAWAEDMAMLNTPAQGVISDTSTTAPSIISNVQSGATSAKNLTAKARDYFTHPEYEIWVYERYKDPQTGDNLLFIFGDDAGSGDFALLNSLEDIIPSRAFNPSIGRSANPTATPGLLLQMLLYDQTAAVDSYFGNILMDLESEALSSTDADPYLGTSKRSANRFEMQRIQVQAPQQTSLYEESIPYIDLDVKEYRMLDKENKPYSLVFIYSNSLNIILANYLSDYRHSLDNIEVEHNAQIRDSEWNLLINSSDSPPLVFGERVSSVQSIFLLPHYKNSPDLIFGAKLIDSASSREENDSSIFASKIIGLGKVTKKFSDPLSVETDRLEMADLILGYEDILKSEMIPFYVPKDGVIPIDKSLMVHFEVYHLNIGDSGGSKFTVKYEVKSQKKNLFSKKQDSEVSLTLNYESANTYFKEDLQIAARELTSGEYVLTLTISDLYTGQQLKREVVFRIEN